VRLAQERGDDLGAPACRLEAEQARRQRIEAAVCLLGENSAELGIVPEGARLGGDLAA
jgi:hypothetical protein